MNLWEAEKELIKLKKDKEELVGKMRELLYQAEFHADEYKDGAEFSWEQRQLTKGIIARFEGLANTIKGVLEDYPQVETKKG